jgi:hypothetical protein
MQDVLERQASNSAPHGGASLRFSSQIQAPSFARWQTFSPAAATFSTTETAPTPQIQATQATVKSASHIWVILSILGDAVVALAAGLIAFWLRFQTSLHEIGVMSELTLQQYSGYIILGSVSLVAMLAWHGIYHRSVLLRSRWIKSHIVQATAIWTLVFLAVVLLLKFEPAISRIYTALYGACTIILLLVWRSLFESILQRPRGGLDG